MIDIISDEGIVALLDAQSAEKAVQTSCWMAKQLKKPVLCLRFASDDAVQTCNRTWREQDKVTDVLSFPMFEAADIIDGEHLGDIIFATDFIVQESQRLHLSPADHACHLLVHSTLHLLGYDHIEDAQAQTMQALENDIMQHLDLHLPYPEIHTTSLS
ncbi:MAG: rRNA maturation RNase YbeY [Mariprofundaceae bacterium]|nr:rRNA maturation RNase YbeY [Mariprofundaceae bacterium]